jgi:hypothetical protein
VSRWWSPARPEPVAEPPAPEGFVLGRRAWGEAALPVVGGQAVLTAEALVRHVLICGATGSGKTETALRLVHQVAERTDALIFYLDAKADRDAAMRFAALMERAGRRARIFPHEPFDGWRGGPRDLHARLMEVIDFARTGPAAFYRDVAKATLALACDHPGGPPRSSGALLERLDLKALRHAHEDAARTRWLSDEQVRGVRMRYEAFFAQARGALDGDWAWDDADAAYLMLPSLAFKDEVRGVARFLLEDFAHFFTQRKPPQRLCVMVVDEFAAIADSAGMAPRVEQARGYDTAFVLCPQVVAGLGDRGDQARLLGNVETVICHRVNTPDEIVALAGTRRVTAISRRVEDGATTGDGTIRFDHEPKIDPNAVRSLPIGTAFVVSRGQAMKLRVDRAPEGRVALPPAVSEAPPPPVARKPLDPLPY